jgi:site-specific DNA recombinase
MALQEGYTVPETHIFQDDYTGTSLNRPQLAQLRDLVHPRFVHAVFVHDQDRLSRKLAHQLLLSEEFEQAGVVLRIVTMPDDAKTPEAQLLNNVRGIIAEYERAKILERTARGRRGRAQSGYVTYGRRTFGYVYVKHANKGEYYDPEENTCRACGQKGDRGACYVVHPEEAALVQRIFRLYVEGGLSLDAIAALLTAEDTPTPADHIRTLPVRVWHRSPLAHMLHNAAYMGTLYEGKTHNLPGKRNPDKKTRHQAVPREEWTPIPVPPIIDQGLFEAAQTRLIHNKRVAKRNHRYAYLFVNGRLRCGQCGRTMYGAHGGDQRPQYRCTRRAFQDVVAPHRRRSVQATAIEPIVWEAVEQALRNPALIADELERRREGTNAQQTDMGRERQQSQRQIAQCEKELARWYTAYEKEVIDLEDFKRRKAEVDARRASAQQELARLDAEQHALELLELETASLKEYCARVRQELQHFALEEKQRALEALDITVTWRPGQALEIRGSIPVSIVNSASCCIVACQ